MLNRAPRRESLRGSGGIAQRILNVGVEDLSFTQWPLYFRRRGR